MLRRHGLVFFLLLLLFFCSASAKRDVQAEEIKNEGGGQRAVLWLHTHPALAGGGVKAPGESRD